MDAHTYLTKAYKDAVGVRKREYYDFNPLLKDFFYIYGQGGTPQEMVRIYILPTTLHQFEIKVRNEGMIKFMTIGEALEKYGDDNSYMMMKKEGRTENLFISKNPTNYIVTMNQLYSNMFTTVYDDGSMIDMGKQWNDIGALRRDGIEYDIEVIIPKPLFVYNIYMMLDQRKVNIMDVVKCAKEVCKKFEISMEDFSDILIETKYFNK